MNRRIAVAAAATANSRGGDSGVRSGDEPTTGRHTDQPAKVNAKPASSHSIRSARYSAIGSCKTRAKSITKLRTKTTRCFAKRQRPQILVVLISDEAGTSAAACAP